MGGTRRKDCTSDAPFSCRVTMQTMYGVDPIRSHVYENMVLLTSSSSSVSVASLEVDRVRTSEPDEEKSIRLRTAANPVRDSKNPMSVAIGSSVTVLGRGKAGCINTVPTQRQVMKLNSSELIKSMFLLPMESIKKT